MVDHPYGWMVSSDGQVPSAACHHTPHPPSGLNRVVHRLRFFRAARLRKGVPATAQPQHLQERPPVASGRPAADTALLAAPSAPQDDSPRPSASRGGSLRNSTALLDTPSAVLNHQEPTETHANSGSADTVTDASGAELRRKTGRATPYPAPGGGVEESAKAGVAVLSPKQQQAEASTSTTCVIQPQPATLSGHAATAQQQQFTGCFTTDGSNCHLRRPLGSPIALDPTTGQRADARPSQKASPAAALDVEKNCSPQAHDNAALSPATLRLLHTLHSSVESTSSTGRVSGSHTHAPSHARHASETGDDVSARRSGFASESDFRAEFRRLGLGGPSASDAGCAAPDDSSNSRGQESMAEPVTPSGRPSAGNNARPFDASYAHAGSLEAAAAERHNAIAAEVASSACRHALDPGCWPELPWLACGAPAHDGAAAAGSNIRGSVAAALRTPAASPDADCNQRSSMAAVSTGPPVSAAPTLHNMGVGQGDGTQFGTSKGRLCADAPTSDRVRSVAPERHHVQQLRRDSASHGRAGGGDVHRAPSSLSGAGSRDSEPAQVWLSDDSEAESGSPGAAPAAIAPTATPAGVPLAVEPQCRRADGSSVAAAPLTETRADCADKPATASQRQDLVPQVQHRQPVSDVCRQVASAEGDRVRAGDNGAVSGSARGRRQEGKHAVAKHTTSSAVRNLTASGSGSAQNLFGHGRGRCAMRTAQQRGRSQPAASGRSCASAVCDASPASGSRTQPGASFHTARSLAESAGPTSTFRSRTCSRSGSGNSGRGASTRVRHSRVWRPACLVSLSPASAASSAASCAAPRHIYTPFAHFEACLTSASPSSRPGSGLRARSQPASGCATSSSDVSVSWKCSHTTSACTSSAGEEHFRSHHEPGSRTELSETVTHLQPRGPGGQRSDRHMDSHNAAPLMDRVRALADSLQGCSLRGAPPAAARDGSYSATRGLSHTQVGATGTTHTPVSPVRSSLVVIDGRLMAPVMCDARQNQASSSERGVVGALSAGCGGGGRQSGGQLSNAASGHDAAGTGNAAASAEQLGEQAQARALPLATVRQRDAADRDVVSGAGDAATVQSETEGDENAQPSASLGRTKGGVHVHPQTPLQRGLENAAEPPAGSAEDFTRAVFANSPVTVGGTVGGPEARPAAPAKPLAERNSTQAPSTLQRAPHKRRASAAGRRSHATQTASHNSTSLTERSAGGNASQHDGAPAARVVLAGAEQHNDRAMDPCGDGTPSSAREERGRAAPLPATSSYCSGTQPLQPALPPQVLHVKPVARAPPSPAEHCWSRAVVERCVPGSGGRGDAQATALAEPMGRHAASYRPKVGPQDNVSRRRDSCCTDAEDRNGNADANGRGVHAVRARAAPVVARAWLAGGAAESPQRFTAGEDAAGGQEVRSAGDMPRARGAARRGRPSCGPEQAGRRTSLAAPMSWKPARAVPEYGDRLRRRPREAVPHSHDRLFPDFSKWLEVSYFTIKVDCERNDSRAVQDVRRHVPCQPGVYEWGCLPPGAAAPAGILAFYLGKAGTNARATSQTLQSRFHRYVQFLDGFVGPCREDREPQKSKLFRDLQRRGFRLFYRFCICPSPEEPSSREEWVLRQLDYAGNERINHGYRQLMLPNGKRVHDYPEKKFF